MRQTEIREYPMPRCSGRRADEDGGRRQHRHDVKLYKHPPSNKPTIMTTRISTTSPNGRDSPSARASKKAIWFSSSTTCRAASANGAVPDEYRHCENATGAQSDAIRAATLTKPHPGVVFAQYMYLPWNGGPSWREGRIQRTRWLGDTDGKWRRVVAVRRRRRLPVERADPGAGPARAYREDRDAANGPAPR